MHVYASLLQNKGNLDTFYFYIYFLENYKIYIPRNVLQNYTCAAI
jgi:hypothetical protein